MILATRHLAVVAAILMSTVLGSIHAFSVFIPEWEMLAGASRANLSLIYSTALIVLTLAVLLGYRLYVKTPPFVLFLIVGVVGSTGLFLSAGAQSLLVLYLTYGVLFGGANGLGYGYALQLAAQAAPTSRGLAMGLVTAFYGVGATIAPNAFVMLIENGGNAIALYAMSLLVLVVAVIAAVLVKRSNIQFASETVADIAALSPQLKTARLCLWLAYGCAVTAGLMVIGHAYTIAIWADLNSTSAAWAVTIVALGNMLGGFSIGFYADKLAGHVLIRALPIVSAIGLLMLVFGSNQGLVVVFVSLMLIGYSYGAIIAVYPIAVVDLYGALASPRIYGQIFTAWGLAGLLGPWVSGWLFDVTQSYLIALQLAVVLSLISFVVIRFIPVARGITNGE